MPLKAAREKAQQAILLDQDEVKIVESCKEWFRELKNWERLETFERAFSENRMCVRVAPIDPSEKKQSFTPKPNVVQTDKDVFIQASMKDVPLFQSARNFLDKKRNDLGLHDVSAVLLYGNKKISQQIFSKVGRQPLFIPIPNEEDLQLLYQIESYAKEKKKRAGQVYDFYVDARARITRIKYGSEEDMKTNFLKFADDKQKVHYRYGDAHETSGPVATEVLANRRQNALNYKSRVLTGKITDNNEVTVKIRQHAGCWPQAAIPGPIAKGQLPEVRQGEYLLVSYDQKLRGIINDEGKLVKPLG